MSAILEVEDVSKYFGALRAVDGVSFAVEEGEIFGIAGPNGSGKSTLFNILTGVPFSALRGLIRFKGRRIERLAPHVICRIGLARTFQRDAGKLIEARRVGRHKPWVWIARLGAVRTSGHRTVL